MKLTLGIDTTIFWNKIPYYSVSYTLLVLKKYYLPFYNDLANNKLLANLVQKC